MNQQNTVCFVLAKAFSVTDNCMILRVSDGTKFNKSVLQSTCNNFEYLDSQLYQNALKDLVYDVFIYDDHIDASKNLDVSNI